MKKSFILTLLFSAIFSLSFSQQNDVYTLQEVDSAAMIPSGKPYFDLFIKKNIKIPFQAQLAGVKGKVYLSAIVETNGTVSNIEIIKGLRPDCDKEVIRLFSLFKAWKPAQKDGKSVRSRVSYPVSVSSEEIQNYEKGYITSFFNAQGNSIASADSAAYLQKAAVDTLTGDIIADIIFYKINGTKLKPYFTLKEKKEYSYYFPGVTKDSIRLLTISHINNYGIAVGEQKKYYPNGNLFSIVQLEEGKNTENFSLFYPNGVLKESSESANIPDKKVFTSIKWLPSGQIHSIIEKDVTITNNPVISVISMWDSTGNQIVKNGNGNVKILSAYEDTFFYEKGVYLNGQKQGLWEGEFKDGQKVYSENYDNGKFLDGVSFHEGKRISYTNPEIKSEYADGGLKGWGSFLNANLSYPQDAREKNIEGKVYINFVVCTDGSLCNFEVIKSSGNSSLDEEALRVVKLSNGKWKPGLQRGKLVKTKYVLPLNFILGK
ncbi:TonB family C-terminal domain-containing protein [Pseudarcicella hirudinis]|uniref:TonB family C-terminal domain-containing protein n=1 Tax=Pseudarcicella hirudinis TaxID=1079859 RepID=A0A1I5S1W0_9BACT|nr:TonB family protein [Pseudarcicella hirudinis]SFP64551.1 TonB family C-terminal domain-containing protein [Pseudarcicella hirudinis]